MALAKVLGLWLLFYCGFVVSLILQAQTSISSSSNSVNTLWDWLKLHERVIVVRLFLSVIFSPLAIHYIPASIGLPIWSVYGAAGFIVDSLLDKFLFIFGRQIGMKVEVPQIAPPAGSNPVSLESIPAAPGKP
jgi:hypothetical protein